jgi:hypothetical protein
LAPAAPALDGPAIAELASHGQWVVWRFEARDGGKAAKVPHAPTTGRRAAVDDPATWGSFAEARAAEERGGYNGIGFVLTDADPYVGVDLDGCRDPDTGAIEPGAQAIVDRLASYTEVTPSGRGLHVWVRATLPPGQRRRDRVEMYDRGRFFAVTGQHVAGTPATIEPRQEELAALHRELFGPTAGNGSNRAATTDVRPVALDDAAIIRRAMTTANGDSFKRLWAGQWREAGHPSQSEADLALCNALAFWTGRDPERIDRLFRQSAAMRQKWEEPHSGDGETYGAMTIRKAIAGCRETYSGRLVAEGNGVSTGGGEASRTEPRDGPVLIRMSDVEPKPVDWLWYSRIARGKVNLIVGNPGLGKTLLMLDIAARTTKGAAWPDSGTAPAGAVVLLTAEDDLADTIRPRLDALEADPSRVVALQAIRERGAERSFSLARDLSALEAAIRQDGAVLVCIDPLTAYLGKIDSFKDAEVRAVLAPLSDLAARTGAAVVGIMHLNKAADRTAVHRVAGSVAFAAAPRVVLAVARDHDNPERRLLLPVKVNLAETPPGLAFSVADGRVVWDSTPLRGLDANDVLAEPDAAQRRGVSVAVAFLESFLASGAPVAAERIFEGARAEGISRSTLKRAKVRLGVKSERIGGVAGEGVWTWRLPPQG